MLVPGGQRVKASSACTRVAASGFTEANPYVAVLMLTIHGREELLFQPPLACARGTFPTAKVDELLRATRAAYSGVVFIYPRERDALLMLWEGHTAREMPGTA